MAVNKTGAIFKSLTFDGESSRDYGIYITGEAVFNAPERAVEMITIPNRNGAFAQDQGRFENIEVTYPAGVFADNEADFAKAVSAFRNMLCSRKGYCRLTDEYNPDEFRLAVYKSGLEVDPVALRAGEFDITFECKPQRYLMSGQNKFIVGDWHDTDVETGDIVEIDNTSGAIEVKSAEVALEPQQDLNGYDKPWSGGNGKNKCEPLSFTGSSGVTFTQDSDGVITANGTATANVYPTVGKLVGDGGTYILSGCTGGSGTTYRLNLYIAGGGVVAQSLNGDSATFTAENGTSYNLILYINSGTALNNIKFYPMIRKSTESSTFEPYTNICPITGASDVDVNVRGFNQWDEETRNGFYNGTTGAYTSNANYICNKNDIKVLPSTDYYMNVPSGKGWAAFFYDANGNFISRTGLYSTTPMVITTPANCQILRFYCNTDYGTTYNNDISINYPSTVTDYEPYNGNTYTTSLGTTVYGGSVDVVGGTGTVTMIPVDLGSLTWARHATYSNCFYSTSNVSNWPLPSSTGADGYCSCYDVYYTGNHVSVAEITNTSQNGHIYFSPTSWSGSICTIIVNDTGTYADATAFKTAMSGQMAIVPTATPTTLTLTPTTIDTIQGVNYVWSEQGDITVEYGTGPDFIINPTLFGCGPLIETKGYGNISFNGHTISLANGAIGTVNLWSRTSGGSLNGSVTKTFATGQFNPTDTFSFRVTHMFTLYEDNPSITNTNANATNSSSDNNDGSVTYIIQVPCTFTINASGQITNKSTYTFGLKKVIADMTVSYNSTTGTVVYSVTTDTVNNPEFASTTQFGFTLWECNAVSTLDRLGDPTYIDCDLGEAYKINDGDIVSLNSFIDLGSDLPELASGANKITCDNTFTEVAITPRWWTV